LNESYGVCNDCLGSFEQENWNWTTDDHTGWKSNFYTYIESSKQYEEDYAMRHQKKVMELLDLRSGSTPDN
jgi:hypothetical protein